MSFDATPDQVCVALIAALPRMGVAPARLDARARRVGVVDSKRTRRLGVSALSVYSGCGTSMTGTKGDSDRLTIRVFANATGIAEGQSDVTLRVSATAQSMIGTDTAPVECGSTGRLERAIFSAVTRDCRFPTPRCANATAIDAVAFGTAKTKR